MTILYLGNTSPTKTEEGFPACLHDTNTIREVQSGCRITILLDVNRGDASMFVFTETEMQEQPQKKTKQRVR